MVANKTYEVTHLSQRTRQNLLAAMQVESFALAKCILFARQAQEHGREELAALFEEAATDEHLKRFEEEAKLAGLLGTDLDNLCNTIDGEMDGVSSMYQRLAEEAAMSADQNAERLFLDLSEGQMLRERIFRSALSELTPPDADPA